MVVGILQVELAIPGALSLKDKRGVVRSIKDRIHKNHQVSVAEVGRLDDAQTALIGITLASSSVPHCDSVLDTILAKLNKERECFVADSDKQILTGQPSHPDEPTLADTHEPDESQ
jgi:uncharacterized protein YlxP (DUF503 family)